MLDNYSILLAVYKKENPVFFDVALKSIVNQTYKSNDIVIVCDGPLTKELDLVIEKYKTSNFNVIRLPENKGLGIALKLGLSACKNDIVMRADSDDYSIPERAEKQITYMVKNNLDVLSSPVYEFNDSVDNVISLKRVPLTHEAVLKYSKKRNPFNHPAVIYRKSCIESVGSYENLPFFEDYFLWVKLFVQNKFKFGNYYDSLVYMRIGDNDALIKRRFSKDAIKSSYILIKRMRELRLLNAFEFFQIYLSRKLINLMPFFIKKFIYKKVLRKKVKKER